MGCEAGAERRRRGRGVSLSTLERGSGPPLLLLHGITANARVWDPVADRLADRYHVVAVDQRGHGQSDAPASGYAAEDFAADIRALVEDLDAGAAVVIGHSMGARNALVAAGRHPEAVAACVAIEFAPGIEAPVFEALDRRIATGCRPFADIADVRGYLAERYPMLSSEAIERRIAGGYHAAPGGGMEPLARTFAVEATARGLREAFEADVLAIKAPTLVVRGGASALVSTAAFGALRRLRPDFAFAELPGASHYLPEEAPEWTIAQLEAFDAACHSSAGRRGTAA